MTLNINLTEDSKKLFVALVEDAGNWGGTPMWGGNVGGSKADNGNLTDLKVKGLVRTFDSDDLEWVQFTDAGRAFAASLGLTISE
jgi:hypothetical protein